MEAPHDVGPQCLSLTVHAEHLLGVDLVDESRARRVGGREEVGHRIAFIGADQQATGLVGQTADAVRHHRHVEVLGQAQHQARVPSALMARAKKQIAKRAAAREEQGSDRTVATNRRARREYEFLETLEAGIVLQGSEVKSLREGTAQITEAYARVDDGELWLFQLHIPPWH